MRPRNRYNGPMAWTRSTRRQLRHAHWDHDSRPTRFVHSPPFHFPTFHPFFASQVNLWCRALSRCYFCAKEFVSRKKKILKSSLVEMLLLPKGTIPLEDFSIGAILTEFFFWELTRETKWAGTIQDSSADRSASHGSCLRRLAKIFTGHKERHL